MAKNKDEVEEKLGCGVLALAIFAAVCGVVLVALCGMALDSKDFWTVDRLVRIDLGYEEATAMTTRAICRWLVVLGCVLVIAGTAGMLGAITRHKPMVSIYVIVTTICAIIAVAAGLSIWERQAVVEPMIERQVDDYCNSTTFIRLVMNVPCDWAEPMYKIATPPCGDSCEKRVELFRTYDGCNTLEHLCKHFQYKEMDTVACTALVNEMAGPDMYLFNTSMTSIDEAGCARACDDDVACDGFIFDAALAGGNGKCVLTGGLPAKQPAPQWTVLPKDEVASTFAGGTPVCYVQSKPRVLTCFLDYNAGTGWIIIILAIALLLTTVISCVFMYEINISRADKPGGFELCGQILCPCLVSSRKAKLLPEDSDGDLTETS